MADQMTETTQRFAIYFAPARDSAHWDFGTRWLGSDPIDGTELERLTLPDVPLAMQVELTAHARRYGLHGTLKPPFQLRENLSLAGLDEAVRALAHQQQTFEFQLSIEELDGFLAWRPVGDEQAINAIAAACVSELDAFRKLPGEAELAKRRGAGLSAQQDALLQRWGYPYVMEEFRLHLTMADRMPADQLMQVRDGLRAASAALSELPVRFDALCIFMEASPGADFRLIARHGFDGESTYYAGWPR